MTPTSFADLGLREPTLAAIADAGYEAPTDIQVHGVPAIKTGRDVILQAQTGTGKTAAFVLPVVDALEANPGVVETLVLVPTRELATQVAGEFERFGSPRGIHATAIYGGTSFQKQYDALETCQVVVATPGRLLDLKRRKKIRLDHVRYFGLDESDEMLSMGFERDVLDIAAMLPDQRQSFLCSATYSDDIKRVARNFIEDPVIVNVSSDQIGAQSVRHEYFSVPMAAKLDALRRLIDSRASDGAIIFANTRAATFRVHETLLAEDVSVDVLNGDLSQAEREKALGRMRADEIKFLVATDVAARGIDISGLPSVVNFDMPESPDVYIHRTGRTGRAGQAGVAYSFVTPADITTFHALQKFYGLELHEESLPTRTTVMQVKADRALDSVLELLDADARLPYAIHLPLARRLAEREDGARLIAKLIAHFDETGPGAATSLSTLAGYARPSTVPESVAAEPVGTPDIEELDEDEARAHRRPRRGGRDEEDEAPKRSRKDRDEDAPKRSRKDRDEDAPKRSRDDRDDEPTASNGVAALERESLFAWLAEQPSRRSRGRWRTVNAIAQAFDSTPTRVTEAAMADERLEESRNRPGSWRVLREFLPERSDEDNAPEKAEDDAPGKPARNVRKKAAKSTPRVATDDAPRTDEEAPKKSRGGSRKAKRESSPFATDGPFVDVKINVGADDINDELEFASELVELAGLDLDDLGGISPKPKQSVIHVVEDFAVAFSEALHGVQWRGHKLSVSRPGGRRRQHRR